MNTEREHQVRERAYHLWVDGGRRDGHCATYWHEAEQQVAQAATAGTSASTRAGLPKAKTGAATKPARASVGRKPTVPGTVAKGRSRASAAPSATA